MDTWHVSAGLFLYLFLEMYGIKAGNHCIHATYIVLPESGGYYTINLGFGSKQLVYIIKRVQKN